MADCYLTNRQKEMLSVLVDGLKNGNVKTDWNLRYGDGRIFYIWGMDNDNLFSKENKKLWNDVENDDFNSFIECGLMEETIHSNTGRSIRLKKAKIINFVKNNYQFEKPQKSDVIEGVMSSNANPYSIDISLNKVFGKPQEHSQYECDVFVVMPFADKFTPIYTDHLKPTVETLGYSIKRGDDFFSRSSIMSDVWSAMVSSDLIIADCTGRNPNVFYELGMAHILDKAVIMITQDVEDIPFDIQHLRFIQYEYTPRGVAELEAEIKEAIEKLLGTGGLRVMQDESGAQFLKRLRKDRDLTQIEFAEELGISKSTIKGLERENTKKPDVALIQKIASMYEINVDDLIKSFYQND